MRRPDGRGNGTGPGTLVFLVILALHIVVAIVSVTAGITEGVPLGASIANWTLAGLLAGVLVARALRHAVGVLLAVVCDLLPLLAFAGAGVVAAAIIEHEWMLVAEAAALVVVAVGAMAPRARATTAPPWVAGAPRLSVASANVFIHNRTPARTAAQILAGDADVVVLNEASDNFLAHFDAAGGLTAMPYRIIDHGARDDYRTVIVARRPFEPGSGVHVDGSLRVVCAYVDVDGAPVAVLGLHLHAAVERRGHSRWLQETAALADVIRDAGPAAVLVGDFNATIDRPQIRELLRLGVDDAHAQFGRGLWPSLKAAASGPLRHVALLRVDHLLVGPDLHTVNLRKVNLPGSDHIGVVATFAVAQPARRSSNASSSGSASGP